MQPALHSSATKSEAGDLAFTDPLTGLGNQRRFHDRIERLIGERTSNPVPFAICILDLDGFKPINDLFGRKSGDAILSQAAVRLRSVTDSTSSVARVGPDEFAFLFPMILSEEAVVEKARMLIELISAPYDVSERTARLSASVGCSLFHANDDTAQTLVDKAESALYQAKKTGRGRVLVYTHEMEAVARHATKIEQALRRAVAAGEVEPYFQPIVNLKDRTVLGFEALARWNDRDLGPVPPSTFIPIAEERGLIGPLSQVVLRKAALAARQWPEHPFLSFNLSPSQLVDQNTRRQICAILEQTDFSSKRLEIELTETGLMSDPASVSAIVDDLKGVGIRISLDDFGTGQSSLGRLRDFQFDKIKIDRSFVTSILDDPSSQHIVRAVLAMCEALALDVVAEGIENEAQAERLAALGCTGGQGYLFGRPADADATADYLRTARLPAPSAT